MGQTLEQVKESSGVEESLPVVAAEMGGKESKTRFWGEELLPTKSESSRLTLPSARSEGNSLQKSFASSPSILKFQDKISYGKSYREQFHAKPRVYLSTEPAPPRAGRHKPYPHNSYITVKHFTDRHNRVLPQPTPVPMRTTSAMFSFSREKSPSMTLVLDEDFKRWMEARVAFSDAHVPCPDSVPRSGSETHANLSKFAHNKAHLEKWPKVRRPKNSIYEITVSPKLHTSQKGKFIYER
ncbi:hypothetical protein PoB_000906100 [Plakobranchus ocellatus]|uniref:Uncharacterized protein n=1 Tax=Plakobranchus ocellatus TaxID=259542 RepID=A0AAV3YJL7_9GAST|nr:hypothetical protein PoB_000906100 [Plakobranchus ocellatus]